MRVNPGSVFIVALASSTSLSGFARAAPAQGYSNAMSTRSETPQPPVAAPDLSSIPPVAGLPTAPVRRETPASQPLEARQLGPLVDTVVAIVNDVLPSLGLKRHAEDLSAAGTTHHARQLDSVQGLLTGVVNLVVSLLGIKPSAGAPAGASPLSADQVAMITNLVESAKNGTTKVPVTVPAALPAPPVAPPASPLSGVAASLPLPLPLRRRDNAAHTARDGCSNGPCEGQAN